MQKIVIRDVISVREGDRIKVTTIFEEDGVIVGDNVQYFALVLRPTNESVTDSNTTSIGGWDTPEDTANTPPTA